jgi:putative Mg2+ transporter-C (MgtC) family protein
VITHLAIVGRIAAGAALGGIIGYERDRHGRPAGLRTHLLVSMTAATFMVVSAHFIEWQSYSSHVHTEVDVSRIAASVVSGIGFLAGGAILRTGANIQGLTTAAGLWLVTAIGMCAGAGMFTEAGSVTLMGVFALTLLRRFEDKQDDVVRRRLHVVMGEQDSAAALVTSTLDRLHIKVSALTYERRFEEKPRIAFTMEAQIPVSLPLEELVSQLEKLPNVRRVHIEHAG